MDERKSNDLPVAKSSNTDKLRSSCKNQKRKNGDSVFYSVLGGRNPRDRKVLARPTGDWIPIRNQPTGAELTRKMSIRYHLLFLGPDSVSSIKIKVGR